MRCVLVWWLWLFSQPRRLRGRGFGGEVRWPGRGPRAMWSLPTVPGRGRVFVAAPLFVERSRLHSRFAGSPTPNRRGRPAVVCAFKGRAPTNANQECSTCNVCALFRNGRKSECIRRRLCCACRLDGAWVDVGFVRAHSSCVGLARVSWMRVGGVPRRRNEGRHNKPRKSLTSIPQTPRVDVQLR